MNKRQIEALRLMVNKGEIFTNKKYREKFNVSSRTALRELSDLVNKGEINEKGRFKDRIYFYGVYKEKMAGKLAGKEHLNLQKITQKSAKNE